MEEERKRPFHSVTVVVKMAEKESESESMKLGSEELSSEFKTLVSSDDLRSLNHLQHTMYVYSSFIYFVSLIFNFRLLILLN